MKKEMLIFILFLILLPFKVLADDCVDSSTKYETSLDSSFEYADFEWCLMSFTNKADRKIYHAFDEYTGLGKKKFNGYDFCGVPAGNASDRCDFVLTNGNSTNSCPDGFSTFRINFYGDDGGKYVGFGCRKDKVVENVIEKSIDALAQQEVDIFKELQIQNSSNYICELETGVDGIIASWSNKSKCILKMNDNVGYIYVNIRNSSTSKLVYRVTIKNMKESHIEGISESINHRTYDYGKPENCSEANLFSWSGVQFCKSSSLSCPVNYSKFNVTAHLSNNIDTTVYGCRKLKEATSTLYENKLNYNSLCANGDFRKVARILGIVLSIVKVVVPLIIIVLGIVDLTKAVTSGDDKALSKATSSLIKRVIAGFIVYIIPIAIMGILNAIEITKGIEKENNSDFGACTKCIFSPYKDCSIK